MRTTNAQTILRIDARPHSLISTFAIHSLKSIMSKLTIKEFSIFYLVSVDVQTDFDLNWWQNPKTYEHQHDISDNVVCSTSKASDQPAHTHGLIRGFASCLNIL